MDTINNTNEGNSINSAVETLRSGGVIAYPTEAVYGLGCDPFNKRSVIRVLELKRRSIHKGLILLSHDWDIVSNLTLPIPQHLLDMVFSTWPGPTTWVFPANIDVLPYWIRGERNSIAIRITAHPISKELCKSFGKPIISTSANIEGEIPVRSYQEVTPIFKGIDYILQGDVGELTKPTPIYDALTMHTIREK